MSESGVESTLIVDIVFWTIAVSTIVAALAVVHLRDVFRAALFLIVSFVGVAGLFVLMRAEFLAIIQVLIYVGAISVLILFAILMTRDVEEGSPANRFAYSGGYRGRAVRGGGNLRGGDDELAAAGGDAAGRGGVG